MTEEERKERQKEYRRKFKETHPNYATEYMRKYRKEHREEWNARCREYQSRHRVAQQKRMNDYHATRAGRATNLLAAYVQMDLERRGERPVLTQEDIIRKCFSKDSKCVYCNEKDWHVLGLDRIDNNLPHHASNVVCSCWKCNVKRFRKRFGEYIEYRGFESFEDWMRSVGATYAEDTITVQYPEDE